MSKQEIIHGDSLEILPTLQENSAQIIIADPPYNIGKDFGNDSDKQPMEEYLKWSEKWIPIKDSSLTAWQPYRVG